MALDLMGDGTRNALAAVLFLQAGMVSFDAMSTVNSSPWTAESFGADPRRLASLNKYVNHAIGISTAYCVVASFLARSPWPLVGSLIANLYLYWLYDQAVRAAQAAGSDAWADGTGKMAA